MIAYLAVNSQSRSVAILNVRPLVWLGDISFSFYAFGQTTLMVCGLFAISIVPAPWLTEPSGILATTIIALAACLIVLLPLAWISRQRIELPAVALGRSLVHQIGAMSDTAPPVSAR